MIFSRISAYAFALVLCAPALQAEAAPSGLGILRPTLRGLPVVRIDGDRIYLGDISPTLPRELLKVDIGPAPNPGRRANISRAAIQNALRRAKADPQLSHGLPANIVIERSAVIFKATDLEREIRRKLANRLPKGVRILQIRGLSAATLPRGEFELKLRKAKLRKSMRMGVELVVNGRTRKVLQVQLSLDGMAETPVLRNDLPRNSVISENDITLAKHELSELPNNAALRSSQVAGRRLRQAQRAGKPLQTSATEKVPLIARGKVVTLVAKGTGLRITQPARVERDAFLGDWVLVRPSAGSRPVRAQVVSGSEVVIHVGANR